MFTKRKKLLALVILFLMMIAIIGAFIYTHRSDEPLLKNPVNNNENTSDRPVSTANSHSHAHSNLPTSMGGHTSDVDVNTGASAKTAKVEVIIMGTSGDVLNNTYIKNNIPNNQLVNQVVKLARKGTPMVTFGVGNRPKMLIIAGIHGAELPAQIAALKLIDRLSHTPNAGTIYVVPFVAPSSTAENTRFWNDQNLNKIANTPGTPSNQLIEKARELQVDVLGDFHSTQPGAEPGRDSILCTLSPTYESYVMAQYISNQTGHELISEYQAGESYPGAVEDVSNLAGIPAVTCEVLSPHGTVTSTTIQKSFAQMLAFLKYKNIIGYA